jgi:hypothetical protein
MAFDSDPATGMSADPLAALVGRLTAELPRRLVALLTRDEAR